MSGLLRGTAIGFTAITVVLWGDLIMSFAGDGSGPRWLITSCEITMLVGVVITGVGTVQSLLGGRPEREAGQPNVVASRLYRIALYFFVASSLIFVGAEAARQLDPDGFFADGPNFGAGAVLLLALLGLLVGAILAVIASAQWITHARRVRAR